MKRFFVILFFLCSHFVIGQSNYKLYYQAFLKANSVESKDSVLYYKLKAITFADAFPKDLLNISFEYYKNENLKLADKYFIKAILNGYQIEPDSDFINIPYKTNYDFGFIEKFKNSKSIYGEFMNTMYNRNKKKIEKARLNFLNSIDLVEDSKFEYLLQNEFDFQKVRLEILPQKNISDSIYVVLNKYMNTGNSYVMLEMLKNNSFPNRKKCRRFNDQTIALLLNHAIAAFVDKEDAKEFVDLLWEQVEKGNITTYDYAKALDHYTSWYEKNNTSLLGTTTIASSDFKTFQCLDVLYPEKLNELRKKYWLNTIEEFCKSTGFLLPSNYVEVTD